MYFSYVVNYQASIGGQGDAILGITSDDSIDLNNYHLYYVSDGDYIDITNNAFVNWTVSSNSILVNASKYLQTNNSWGPLYLRVYVPESSVNAINHTSFTTGWFTNFKNISMFQNVSGDSATPYFRGQDATIYSSETYSPTTDVYAFEGINNLTGNIKITDYGNYPVDGKNLTSGIYTLTYSVTDSNDVTVTYTRTITVKDDQTAIDTKDSTLVTGPNTSWSAGDNFVDAKDADGNKVDLANITVSGNVDTTKAGSYEVTYSYTDKAGNVISKTITVTVIAKQEPITPNHDDFNDNSGNNSTINDDTKSISTTNSVNTKMTKVVKAPNVVEKSSFLPQTGDEGSSETTIIGMILVILASVGSIFGLGKQNKNRN